MNKKNYWLNFCLYANYLHVGTKSK